MLKMSPMALDEESIAESVEGLEKQLNGMAENLGSFQPTIGLTPDGRLMYALAQDPHGPNHVMYPVGGYARPLRPENISSRHRLRRVVNNARRLHARLAPFIVQSLPAPGFQSMRGLAMSVGYMASRGLDVTWNGDGWHVTAGAFRFSESMRGMTPADDIEIEAHAFPNKSGVIYVDFDVSLDEQWVVKIKGAKVKFFEGEGNLTIRYTSSFRYDGSKLLDFGWPLEASSVMAPLAYVLAPTDEKPAPAVVQTGWGQLPTTFMGSIPFSDTNDGVRPYYP